MTAEDVARLCEIFDEEFSDQCEDDNGENYAPSENDKQSDVKDVFTGGRIPIETEVEVNSEDDEEVTTVADNTETPLLTDVYRSSNSTLWNKSPLPGLEIGFINVWMILGNRKVSSSCVGLDLGRTRRAAVNLIASHVIVLHYEFKDEYETLVIRNGNFRNIWPYLITTSGLDVA
ncbi:hypothetical protein FQA39_LY05536 [Lamprigera yunnana]|nr:hypothetical protein FQA39_LY05536 [Lamprigera yunnana]